MSGQLKAIPRQTYVYLGCDPEVFVTRVNSRGRKVVVPSDVILGDKKVLSGWNGARMGFLAQDGVQIELQPNYSTCRESLSYYLTGLMINLASIVAAKGAEFGEEFKIEPLTVVRLTKGDIALLTPEARRLGCTPSKNIYGRKQIERDGETYPFRSGAGHIHLGIDVNVPREAIVKVADLILGVTSVLIDRDPGSALRRKTYGRAGEYRLPKYGVEYRTLSNFWLRSYPLTSFVMGMARSAVAVVDAERCRKIYAAKGVMNVYPESSTMFNAADILLDGVNFEHVEEIINENDWAGANELYRAHIRPFFEQVALQNSGLSGGGTLLNFDFFVDAIRARELAGDEDPLGAWFPLANFTDWYLKYPSNRGRGWESWLGIMVGGKRTIPPTKVSGIVMVDSVAPPPVGIPGGLPADSGPNQVVEVEVTRD